jgi:hypothetical protein
MNPKQVYNNIRTKKDPLDLHPRTLDGDWSQRKDDQLQMNSNGSVKIRTPKIRIK